MFYYPAVLNRQSGCFATIWLVATKGIKVTRKDFLKVNVKMTCDDIMSYVLERVAPPQPGLPRPRFSLYLSSQLQYGVVLVYHRQCTILLEELQFIVGQLLKQRSLQKIDLDDHSRQTGVLPDALSLMEDTEGAPDPLFGVMLLKDMVPSPSLLIEMSREYLREASPECHELTSPAASVAPELGPGITASPETITLKETESVAIPAAEFEDEDFTDHLPQTIDFLLEQADHFPEGGWELPPEEMRGSEREEREQEKIKDMTGSTTELQPTTVSSEGPELLPQEEQAPAVEIPSPPRDQLTPVSAPSLPSPPSATRGRLGSPESEEVQPEVKRRRRRQLAFFDPETQLSEKDQQQQIENPLTETRPPPLFLPPSHRIVPAAELLSNPCSFLPEEIQCLWRRTAAIMPLLGSDLQVGERGPESTDSEREREWEMMEVAEREEQRLKEIPTEVQREMVESEMLELSADDSLPLEASDQKEVSREISPLYTSEREGSTFSTVLQDIPEMVDEMMERVAAESPRLLPELMEREESVVFQSLLPPEVNRRTVSSIFHRLLENLSYRRICAEQEEPYGDIMISPGVNYEEMNLPL
ncbi:meiotic recombination protein REC8 homolog [Girardinichthys multiradiatus]|uniref:meiotic recombination protein REC8 homolog n=1 Tax=Girardinichthys multiradiatus TaxID=208333 RepID=UPI001FACD091|nr:meiotic recombination protein REC8 homolog [Girardinichthys multiradiatus]